MGKKILGGALSLGLMVTLNGCGFSPMLAEKSTNTQVATRLMTVKVEGIPDRTGQQLRSLLNQRLGGGQTHYLLNVRLETDQSSIGMSLDSTTNRYQMRLQAFFTLRKSHHPSAQFSGYSQALCSWNVLTDTNPILGSSEYSNVASQEAALTRALGVVAQDIYTQIAAQLAQDPDLKLGEGAMASQKSISLFDTFSQPMSLATDEGQEGLLDRG
jgi:hypothetical protein